MMQSTHERRKPRGYQIILQALIPALILGVVTWGANKQIVSGEKIAMIEVKVNSIDEKLARHDIVTKEAADRNGELHHRKLGISPCNGCHEK